MSETPIILPDPLAPLFRDVEFGGKRFDAGVPLSEGFQAWEVVPALGPAMTERIMARTVTEAHRARCTYPDCPDCPLVAWYGRDATPFSGIDTAPPAEHPIVIRRVLSAEQIDRMCAAFFLPEQSHPTPPPRAPRPSEERARRGKCTDRTPPLQAIEDALNGERCWAQALDDGAVDRAIENIEAAVSLEGPLRDAWNDDDDAAKYALAYHCKSHLLDAVFDAVAEGMDDEDAIEMALRDDECPPPDEAGVGMGIPLILDEELPEVGDGNFFNSAGDTNPDNDVREP